MEGAKQALVMRSDCKPQGQPPAREGYLHGFWAHMLITLQERTPFRHYSERLVGNPFQIAFQSFQTAGAGQRMCCPATSPSTSDKATQPRSLGLILGWIVPLLFFFRRTWLP